MKKAKKCGKVSLVFLLCLLMLICSIPMGTAAEQRPSSSVADTTQLRQKYLKKDEATRTLYPNGAVMFPLSSSELKMKEFYSFDVFRQGGTKGKATVKVSTIDLTAEYGTDYNIYTTNEINADPVKGKANPYYAIQNYSFIPVEGETETEYKADEDSEDAKEMRKSISEYNDTVNNEVMPTSSSFNLTFEDGENVRTIYIETLKSKYVRDDLQFYLSVSNPKNCEVGEVTTSMFTIKEEREKPESYVAVKDAKVNPKAGEAYVKINRTGNLGKTVNFTVKTKEGSANGVENYKAVCKSLTFLPGMTEIKLPVPLTDAKNNTYFNVVLEDVSGAKVKDNSGKVLISSGASVLKNETGYSKTDTGYGTYKIDGIRNVEFVDLSKLENSRRLGSKQNKGVFKYLDNNHAKIGYNGGAFNYRHHALSVRMPDKIEFTGVDKIHIAFKNCGGSTAWDNAAICITDFDPLSCSESNCDWMVYPDTWYNFSWNLTNISSSKLYKETKVPDQVSGIKHLFYVVHKGPFPGSCGVEFFNEGYNGTSYENNTYLKLKKYTVKIKDNNNNVMMYRDGKLQSVKSDAYSDLTFNSLTSKDKLTSVDMYRGESASFSYALDNSFKGKLRIVGYRLYNDGNYTQTISCDGEQFTLSLKLLNDYSSYIKDNTITVEPVFRTVDSEVQIQSYEYYGADDDNTGLSFKENSDKTSGVVTYNEKTIGTLKWNSTKRENQSDKYNALEGDDVTFTYTPDPSCTEKWVPSFIVRQNDNEDMLSSTTPQIINATNNKCSVRIDKGHVRIRPMFDISGLTKLVVKNPGAGLDYTGKGSPMETIDSSTREATVTGYYSNNTKVDFSKTPVGNIVTFSATPKEGYRAKWQYTDSATSKVKTYYGTDFFYAVQYANEVNDNYVSLTFEKTDNLDRYSVGVTGKVLAKKGTIICPGSDEITQKDEDYVPAKNSTLMFGSCMSLSDLAGNFLLKQYDTKDPGIAILANIEVSPDEVHRVLAYYNGHYYIRDITIKDCLNRDNTSINLDIRLPYKTYGITPTDVTVTDSNTTYSSSVTLYDKTVYSIKVDFDRSSESTDKPVNMATFVVERDGLDVETFNEEIDETSSTVTLKNPLCESVKSK
ncbi:MAG: Calx-beta domain-containing protein, partial [Ruminococcus sp.]